MNHRSSRLRKALVPLLAALVLAGCATPAAVDPASLPLTPPAFRNQDASRVLAGTPLSAEAQTQGRWWAVFADPVLDQLVEQAGRNNSSVQVAAGRLAQARALLRASDANRLPQVELGAGAVRQQNSTTGNRPQTVVSVGANLSWELDLMGRLSLNSDAASLDAASREALLRSTQLLVQAHVAQTYVQLRAFDAERALVHDTLKAYRDTLRLTEVRFREGDVAELDVARVRTEVASTELEALALDRRRAELQHALAVLVGEVASTESEALALDRRRAELQHALAVLVGEVASSFEVKPAEWATALPVIPAGVPSTVLVRRPDVSAAQSNMQAAQARAGVAKAAWFPSFSLTATGGYAAPEISDLFKMATRAWGVGALLSLPMFDGGRREAGVANANAELDIALASYREQILVAFREVEDQLSALRLLAAQSEAQSRSVASAARATVLSGARYRNGCVSQLELLDAQRSELRNRREALQVRAAQYLATVGLIRALGGGWSS